jgi:hypothetical protein
MKKHAQTDLLAARLAEAANKPVSVVPFAVPPTPEPEIPPPTKSESEAISAAPSEQRKPGRRRKARVNARSIEEPEDDTVPISLRPRRDLLTRYVLAASERTRETGRVISAQQIMLETLEEGP